MNKVYYTTFWYAISGLVRAAKKQHYFINKEKMVKKIKKIIE